MSARLAALEVERVRGWVQADAAALAAQLEGRVVPRAARAAARALLVRVFDALGALETTTGAEWVSLMCALDQATWGRDAARPLRPLARIGVPPLRGAVRARFYERVFDYARSAEQLSERLDRFVAATGGEPPRLFVRSVSPGDAKAAAETDMALTRG
jgi:hypothetical protein